MGAHGERCVPHTVCVLAYFELQLSATQPQPQPPSVVCVCSLRVLLQKEQALQFANQRQSATLSTIINVALSLRAPNRSTPGPTSLPFSPLFNYTALWPSTPANTNSSISMPSTTLQSCIISRCPWFAFVCTADSARFYAPFSIVLS